MYINLLFLEKSVCEQKRNTIKTNGQKLKKIQSQIRRI